MDAGRVALLAACLAARAGKAVHVVAPSDEQARREAGRMAPHYAERGVHAAVIDAGSDQARRRAAYLAEVTYATARELGFDYLRDRLAPSLAAQVQRGHAFAVIADVDEIGLATRREPLVLSVPGEARPEVWVTADRLVRQLSPGREWGGFWIDERARAVPLTERGVATIERQLGLDHLYTAAHLETLHTIEQALRAHHLLQRDRDYRVEGGAVLLLDQRTGEPAPSRRLPHGLHEALEAKESAPIRAPLYPVARITLRSYFGLYERVGGLSPSGRQDDPSLALRRMLEYDEVEDRQRQAVYDLRQRILEGGGPQRQALELARSVVDALFAEPAEPGALGIATRAYFDLEAAPAPAKGEFVARIERKFAALAAAGAAFESVARRVILAALDGAWQVQLAELEALRESIGLRAYGRRDPVVEYRRDAQDLFRTLHENLAREALSTLFRLHPAHSDQLDELRRRAGLPNRKGHR